jgi:hypothetical protein
MEPQIEPRTVERRRAARQKSFLRGTVHFNNRRSVLDCLVRDVSPYGARLIFSDVVSTPDTMELHIPQKDETLRTHVIWRYGREVGVAFAHIMKTQQASEGGNLAERVARLEAELETLKRALRKLKLEGINEFEAN